jgi:hypothetical protein
MYKENSGSESEEDFQQFPSKVKDYKLKPLKKFFRPYFSPRIRYCEIDYALARDAKWIRWYFVYININTKYLIMHPLEAKKKSANTDET